MVVFAVVFLAELFFFDLDDLPCVTTFAEFSLFAELDLTTLLDAIDLPCFVAFRGSSFMEPMPRCGGVHFNPILIALVAGVAIIDVMIQELVQLLLEIS